MQQEETVGLAGWLLPGQVLEEARTSYPASGHRVMRPANEPARLSPKSGSGALCVE